jgi:hypothetical protein
MISSCTELINIFNRVGGKIEIDYHKKTCKYGGTTCSIKSKDRISIDLLLTGIAQDYKEVITEIPTFTPVEKIHHYQDLNIRGFIAELEWNEYGIGPVNEYK